MQEHKFLLGAHHKVPKGYAILQEPDYERLAWVKMQKNIKSSERYLKHFIEREWIDTSAKDGMHVTGELKIPLGDLNVYLIVYTDGWCKS